MNLAGSIGAAVAVGLGLLVCFFGYQTIRVTIVVAGLMVGATVGAGAVGLIPGSGQVAVLMAAVGAGLLGAVLAAVLMRVGVFLLGAGAGALATAVVGAFLGWLVAPWVLVVGGAIGGILALIGRRVVIGLLTGLAGAWGVASGIAHWAGWGTIGTLLCGPATLRIEPARFYALMAVWLTVGLAGFAVQVVAGRRRRKRQ